jgi:hypothetical protein
MAMAAVIGGTAASPIGESLGLGVVVKAESIVQILDSIDACAWYQVYVYNGSQQVGSGFLQVSPYYNAASGAYEVPAYVLGMSESQSWTSVTTSYSGPGYC